MAGLFKVVMTWNRTGEPNNTFVNVFGYRSNLPITGDENYLLNQEFRAQMVPELVKVMSNVMGAKRCEVYNVSDGIGYADFPYLTSVPGLRTGDPLPNFNAWGFQYNRVAAGKRNGFKRIGAISESDTAGNVAAATITTALGTLTGKLAAAIKFGTIDQWFPEILERKPTGVYPWTSHPISSVSYIRITTQNSRKR